MHRSRSSWTAKCAIVAWHTSAVRQNILEGEVLSSPLILEDKVVADELAHRGRPLDVRVLLIVCNQKGDSSSGECFRRRPGEEVRARSHRRRR